MMTITSRAAAIAITSLFLVSAASAQTTPPAAAQKTDAAAPAEKKASKPRTAESIECSKEADAKNLHGKAERKPFMRECKRAAREAAAKK
jgi:hypothetical protein